MRFLIGCLLLAFLTGAYNYSYAQTTFSGVHGKAMDEQHLAAEAATVILLAAADSSIIKSIVCDKNGTFTFTVIPGNYLLLISKIGYEQYYTGIYRVQPNQYVATTDIILKPHTPQLKEVSITAQRSYVDVKPDRVVLNVQNSIVAEGNSVFEILKQAAPGAHVDGRGNISIIGHQNALITMDGKPVHVTGQDLVDLLQGTPGSTVQQIELITNPSVKYEAAGAGIINIISKKGTNAGTNFTLTAGAGYGKFGKATGGLTFNNRMGKINIFGNYNYSYNKTDHTFRTDRLINYNGLLSDYDVNYYATQQGHNQSFRLGTDYAISANHTIGVLVGGTINDYNFVKNNILNITNSGVLDSTISTKSKLNRGQSNTSYDVNYTGKLDTNGKTLSADFVFNDIDRHSTEYIDNYFYNSAHANYRPSLYLQNLSPADIHIWAAKVDFVNPLSKKSKLEAGLKYSSVESSNELVFGPKVNGVYQSSPNFSSSFAFKENINSAYLNYSYKMGKVNLILGLRAEQTNTTGNGTSTTMTSNVDKSYLDWFPQAQLDYQPDSKNEYNISYNRGITRAAYEVVNPFLYYVDLYDYRAGNPNLLPEYSDKIQLTHIYNKIFVTTLYGTIITNFFDLNNYVQNDQTKVSVTTTSNFGKYYVVGIKFSAPVVFSAWWNANFTMDASYQRFKAYPAYGNLNKGTKDIILTSAQSFKISNTLFAEVSGKYETPNFYGIAQFKYTYRVDAALSKQLFNKNATLRLSINDIFNSQRDMATVNYQNLNMNIYDKIETRIVRIGFTYRFGNISLKGIMKHNAGNEEEQRRAAGSVAGNVAPGN